MDKARIVALDTVNRHTTTINNVAKIDIDLNNLFFDLMLYMLKGIDKNKADDNKFLFAIVEASFSKSLWLLLLILNPISWYKYNKQQTIENILTERKILSRQLLSFNKSEIFIKKTINTASLKIE